MVILRAATLYIIPVAVICSLLGLLPLAPLASIGGTLFGYGLLWSIRKLFWLRKGKEGLGLGDLDLLALIGAFTGIIGAWLSLVIGSVAGMVIALWYLLTARTSKASVMQVRIPFGPLLALGAISYVLIGPPLTKLLLGI